MKEKEIFDSLYAIVENRSINDAANKELQGITRNYKELQDLGYITDTLKMTKRGDDYLNKFKIDNAIILAAGFSSRFAPVCFDVPKGLLKAKNEILIERQIKQLNEKGIADISIVTGCFHEQFCYLKEKFGVRLIYNADYSTKNNFASVFAAKKYLGNTIITSSDLYFSKNIFQSHAYDAYYSSVYIQGPTEERGLKLDEDDKMIETFYHCSDVWITLGYAFFSKRFSENYIKIVEKIYNTQEYANKFWADIQDEYLLELFMYIKRCDKSDIYEFDYLEELWEFDSDFKAIEASNTMRFICQFLNCDERELSNFYPIKSDNTVIGCSFFYNNTKYNYFLNDKNIFTSNKE